MKNCFHGTTFACYGTLTRTHSEIRALIEDAGGRMCSNTSNGVFFLLCSEEAFNMKYDAVLIAKATGVAIVREDFLYNSLQQKRVLNVFRNQNRKKFSLYVPPFELWHKREQELRKSKRETMRQSSQKQKTSGNRKSSNSVTLPQKVAKKVQKPFPKKSPLLLSKKRDPTDVLVSVTTPERPQASSSAGFCHICKGSCKYKSAATMETPTNLPKKTFFAAPTQATKLDLKAATGKDIELPKGFNFVAQPILAP